MTFRDYIKKLSEQELEGYALACETTSKYITTHLMPARKIPKRSLLIALSEQSGGHLSEYDVLRHFGLLKSRVDEESIATEKAA